MADKKTFSWMIIAVCWCGIAVGQPQKTFPLSIHFQNQVGEKRLNLDSTYTNPHGETFTIRNFRYYVGQFWVQAVNGKKYELPVSYFLIDERKPATKTIVLPIPFQSVKAVHFTIGVDSGKNVSGVQTGALDPANGMFWTWNSGYIFAKLEGTSPQAKAPQNAFTYHIGGFRSGVNAARKVKLDTPAGFSVVRDSVVITADVNTWFSGVHPFKIAAQASIMTPGPAAMQVADNYSKMFGIATDN